MSHPFTRAERRNHRQRIIDRGIRHGTFLRWFAYYCRCHIGYQSWRTQQLRCEIHDPKTREYYRTVGKWAKSAPRNWINDMEPEWFLSGVLRRDYRAGGGRRQHNFDTGSLRRYYGKFYLHIADVEWNDSTTSVDEVDWDDPETEMPTQSVRVLSQARAKRRQRYLRRATIRKAQRERLRLWLDRLQPGAPLRWDQVRQTLSPHEYLEQHGLTREGQSV